jgi:inorganic phosphate transporter, PiT family
MGVGAAKRLSAVRWGVAGNIVRAWIVTLPAAGAIGAITYEISNIFGSGALGPLLISVAGVSLLVAVLGRRFQRHDTINRPDDATPAPATP